MIMNPPQVECSFLTWERLVLSDEPPREVPDCEGRLSDLPPADDDEADGKVQVGGVIWEMVAR